MMEDGLRRAIADDHLRNDVSPSALAEHIRGGLNQMLRLWEAAVMNDSEPKRQAAFGLDVALLPIAENHTRDRLLGLGKRGPERPQVT